MIRTPQMSSLLLLLWVTIFLVSLVRAQWESVYVMALIIIPLLVELLNLREELNLIKGETALNRRLLNERSKDLYDKLQKSSKIYDKKDLVDFEEFAYEKGGKQRREATTALLESSDTDEEEGENLPEKKPETLDLVAESGVSEITPPVEKAVTSRKKGSSTRKK